MGPAWQTRFIYLFLFYYAERKSRPRLSLPLGGRCFLLLSSPYPFPIYDRIVPIDNSSLPLLGTRNMRLGRTEAQGRNRPFRSPNTRHCLLSRFAIQIPPPVPCVHYSIRSPLTPFATTGHGLQSVNPHLPSFVLALCSHSSLFHSNVSYYYPSLVSPSSLFFLFPSDNDLGPIGQSTGPFLSLYGSRSVFTPKYIIAFPCFSCQASCWRCDQG